MQTPSSMVMGIVLAPLGLVLMFTAAITPQWREGQARLGAPAPGLLSRSGLKGQGSSEALLLLRSDGLWESCLQVAHSELKQCWPVAGAYLRDPRLRVTRGLVLTALFLCAAGVLLACIGVRCWADAPPRGLAAAGGLLVVLSGLLSLAALGVYTHSYRRLGAEDAPGRKGAGGGGGGNALPRLPHLSLRPAGSLYFGWLGAGIQVLGGVALMLSLKRPRCRSGAPCPVCPETSGRAETEVYEVSC